MHQKSKGVEEDVRDVMAGSPSIWDPLFAPEPQRAVRGGWRMQSAGTSLNERSRSPFRPTCKAAIGHLKDWAEGISSAVRIWRHFNNLVSDGPVHPAIARLARIGSSGSSTDHNHQTNLSALLATCGFSDMIWVRPVCSRQ